MKKLVIIFALFLSVLNVNAKIENCPADMVNPLMGTLSKHSLSTGNTYPAIALPWGMNFWVPQTGRMGDGWGYIYTEDKIRDFKQTHQPSPWINDYGQFAMMPQTGAMEVHQDKRASWFSHKAEESRPYYYKAYLADYDVTTEIAPTERAMIMRVTYPETSEANFIVDAFDNASSVTIDEKNQTITGYTTKNSSGVPDNFKNYFVLKFDHPFTVCKTADIQKVDRDDYGKIVFGDAKTLTSSHAAAVVRFASMKRGEQVNVRVASSFISPEQAMANLQELGGRSFDQVKSDAKAIWNKTLGVFEIDDPDRDNLRTFYSCLYRAVLFPRTFWEVANGKPVHYSPYDGKVYDGYMYTDAGFWDVFRCLFPLLNLVYPETNEKIQAGLANTYRESGFLPEWMSPGHRGCMVGNNSASIVADAILLGLNISDADKQTLWEAVCHGANAVHPEVSSTGRRGYEYYNKLGYVPYDVDDQFGHINENVARTLEYAYDDWCIYKMGKALGKTDKELAPFKQHALNYENVFDNETKLMRGRNSDGTFQSPYSPMKWGDAFTEGNGWHYTWSVFHDPQGLKNLMGGQDIFNAMLDSVFNVPPVFDDSYYGGVIHEIREMQIMNMGNYAHGNQPIQHMIYLYDWSAQPWKTQYWIRETMDKLYAATPDGYCGDEDNGQTSAWYVFSAMGFYPVCPGSGEYALGTPYFQNMKVHLHNGNTLEISAHGNTASTRYVQSMTLNGENYDKNYVTYDQLQNGGKIVFQMGKDANKQRGVTEASAPYSYTNELGEKVKVQLRKDAAKAQKKIE